MRSVYDAILFVSCIFTSAAVVALSGTTVVTSAFIDTKGYNSAVLRGHTDIASGTPTTATAAFALLECATSGGSYTAANDNTGTQIGFTLNAKTAVQDGLARIEGLNVNRLRYLEVSITPAFTGGSSPAINAFAEIALGRAYELPPNTAVSNT